MNRTIRPAACRCILIAGLLTCMASSATGQGAIVHRRAELAWDRLSACKHIDPRPIHTGLIRHQLNADLGVVIPPTNLSLHDHLGLGT